MNNQGQKTRGFEVDRPARAVRRSTRQTVKKTYLLKKPTGETISRKQEYQTTLEASEARQTTRASTI